MLLLKGALRFYCLPKLNDQQPFGCRLISYNIYQFNVFTGFTCTTGITARSAGQHFSIHLYTTRPKFYHTNILGH